MGIRRIFFAMVIFASLFASVVFSMKSFTGYLISDIADNGSNLYAFIFLILGVAGSLIYLFKFRHK